MPVWSNLSGQTSLSYHESPDHGNQHCSLATFILTFQYKKREFRGARIGFKQSKADPKVWSRQTKWLAGNKIGQHWNSFEVIQSKQGQIYEKRILVAVLVFIALDIYRLRTSTELNGWFIWIVTSWNWLLVYLNTILSVTALNNLPFVRYAQTGTYLGLGKSTSNTQIENLQD